eukprot:673107-Pelagomonas_calceolata.AAC.3
MQHLIQQIEVCNDEDAEFFWSLRNKAWTARQGHNILTYLLLPLCQTLLPKLYSFSLPASNRERNQQSGRHAAECRHLKLSRKFPNLLNIHMMQMSADHTQELWREISR